MASGRWRTGSLRLCIYIVISLCPLAAQAESCSGLGCIRNAIYKARGYWSRTPPAIEAFGSAGGQFDDVDEVPLSARQHQVIADIVEQERIQGCRD